MYILGAKKRCLYELEIDWINKNNDNSKHKEYLLRGRHCYKVF